MCAGQCRHAKVEEATCRRAAVLSLALVLFSCFLLCFFANCSSQPRPCLVSKWSPVLAVARAWTRSSVGVTVGPGLARLSDQGFTPGSSFHDTGCQRTGGVRYDNGRSSILLLRGKEVYQGVILHIRTFKRPIDAPARIAK